MRFTSYIGASAVVALATAQTFTECNPTEKECPNNPAMPATFETDFKAGAAAIKGWKQTAGSLKYSEAGADFTLAAKGDAPTIQTEGYLHFGYIEVKAKAAPGQGIVSSIVLQSEDLDEVDWEFIGTVNNQVQMNYFGKGNTTTFDRMIPNPVSNAMEEFHTYALNWTAESLTWIIDTKPVRTLNFADANGGKTYPQTPSTVRIGIWAGGDPSNNKGTIEWAGGKTDYSKAPFTMSVESVKIINYSPGSEYKWTDKSGSFESIEVIEPGKAEGAPVNSAVIAPTATATGAGISVAIPTAEGGGYDAPKASGGYNAPKPSGGNDAPKPSGSVCAITTVTVTLPPGEQPPVTGEVPPPAENTGIVTDTAPAPTAPYPTEPVPVPTGNATTSAPPFEFTGAASQHKAGAFVGLLAGAVMLLV